MTARSGSTATNIALTHALALSRGVLDLADPESGVMLPDWIVNAAHTTLAAVREAREWTPIVPPWHERPTALASLFRWLDEQGDRPADPAEFIENPELWADRWRDYERQTDPWGEQA